MCSVSIGRTRRANIFDSATTNNLREHLEAIESDNSVTGVIITSAKKSIFIAGADLQTLLRQAQTGELRAFIAEGQRVFEPARRAQSSNGRCDSWGMRGRWLRNHFGLRLSCCFE